MVEFASLSLLDYRMARKSISILISLFFLLTNVYPSQSAEILSPNAPIARSGVDLSDDLTDYQVRIIYVVPADVEDRQLDTSGRIALWLDQASTYAKSEIGLTPPFDTYRGKYDIGFLKSKYTTAQLSDLKKRGDEKLLGELDPASLRKVKGVGFVVDAKLDLNYCGWASRPGQSFLVTLGKSCWEDTDSYNSRTPLTYISRSILHEWFHNLGVQHTCVTDDLMWGDGCEAIPKGNRNDIDLNREHYLSAAKSGVDISLLPVWLESDRSQKIYLKPTSTFFPTSLSLGTAYEYLLDQSDLTWSENGEGYCLTVINGKEIPTIATSTYQGSRFSCKFNMPKNLPINSKITMTVKGSALWSYTTATSQVFYAGSSGKTGVCTGPTCSVGDVYETSFPLCFKTGGVAALQKYTNGEWVTLKTHRMSTSSSCSSGYSWSAETRIALKNGGTFTLRWVKFADSSRTEVIRESKTFELAVGETNA